DGMNRVQYVDFTTGTPPTTTRTHTYGYNQVGNVVAKDDLSFNYSRLAGMESLETLAPHAVRKTTSSVTNATVTYSYDLNGNMKGSDAGSVVTWRTFNQPDEIKKVST